MKWLHRKRSKLRLMIRAVLCAAGITAGMAGMTADRAMAASGAVSIGRVPELRDWYGQEAVNAVLTGDLKIENSVTLGENTSYHTKKLDMKNYSIHIMPGGRLIIDNEDLLLTGTEMMITVEYGGTLELRRGTIKGKKYSNVILIKGNKGWRPSTEFNLTGNIIRTEAGESQESGENTQPQILSVDQKDLSLVCALGSPLSSLTLPAEVQISYRTAEGKTQEMELPIQWDASGISTRTAGVFSIKGTFSEDTLKQYNLTNPANVKGTLSLTVMKPEDIGTLNVRMITQDSAGNTVIRLEFPILASDVTALYLYSSTDGQHFQKESWTRAGANGSLIPADNFLAQCIGNVNPPWQYLDYRCRPDGPFWLQIEVVGSPFAGKSNVVKCDSLEDREPGKMKIYGKTNSSGISSGTAAGDSSQMGISGGGFTVEQNGGRPGGGGPGGSGGSFQNSGNSGDRNGGTVNLPDGGESLSPEGGAHGTGRSGEENQAGNQTGGQTEAQSGGGVVAFGDAAGDVPWIDGPEEAGAAAKGSIQDKALWGTAAVAGLVLIAAAVIVWKRKVRGKKG